MAATPPNIYSCSEWGAEMVHVAFAESAAQGIVIHHTAGANRAPLEGDLEVAKAKERAKSIQHDHIHSNHWSDSGHHFLVSKGGVILEGRHGSRAAAREGHVVRGAHSSSNLHNRRWFGIEIEGNYKDGLEHLPNVQWKAVEELCAWLSFWGEFQTLNIRGHQQVAPPHHTECPGKLMSRLAGLRNAVHDRKVEIMGESG